MMEELLEKYAAFDYLIGCWKRLNTTKNDLAKKKFPSADTKPAFEVIGKARELVLRNLGLVLSKPGGPDQLLPPLLALSPPNSPWENDAPTYPNQLSTDTTQFIQELAPFLESADKMDAVMRPLVRKLLFHPSLLQPESIESREASWRGVVAGLEALISNQSIAVMITKMDEFNPQKAMTGKEFESISLLGPLCRLGVLPTDWPKIRDKHFWNSEVRQQKDIDFAFSILRDTLRVFQAALYRIFNVLVRSSPESREAVLAYFARVIALNAAGQEDPSSDSFLLNLQTVLFRFAENFMDHGYTKLDRIDPFFYARSSLIDLTHVPRLCATEEEATAWAKEHALPPSSSSAPASPDFVSSIFFLCISMSHIGYLNTISKFIYYAKLHRRAENKMLRFIDEDFDFLNSVSESSKGPIKANLLAYQVQVYDPEFVHQCIAFTSMLGAWLIRQADPMRTHPNPAVVLPLPEEVPQSFAVLPQYLVQVILDYLSFSVWCLPHKHESIAAKTDLLHLLLTFLTSPSYIPVLSLKSKISRILFLSIWAYGREPEGVLGVVLNKHPLALKHLMFALTQIYMNVDQLKTSSWAKYTARQNVTDTLQVVWSNVTHREALHNLAKDPVRFSNFLGMMLDDVAILVKTSISYLNKLPPNIDRQMINEAWSTAESSEQATTIQRLLLNLDFSVLALGVLRKLVRELKSELVEVSPMLHHLARTLNETLELLADPRYYGAEVYGGLESDLKPLLGDTMQIYLDLGDQPDFVRAVIEGGYRREVFITADDIAVRKVVKAEIDLRVWRQLEYKLDAALRASSSTTHS